MNHHDFNDLRAVNNKETNNIIGGTEDAIWNATKHAYLLGLKRGQENCAELVKALKQIAAIQDQMFGSDWEEIEEARTIARAALSKFQGENHE